LEGVEDWMNEGAIKAEVREGHDLSAVELQSRYSGGNIHDFQMRIESSTLVFLVFS
jgi:hypothetical protein